MIDWPPKSSRNVAVPSRGWYAQVVAAKIPERDGSFVLHAVRNAGTLLRSPACRPRCPWVDRTRYVIAPADSSRVLWMMLLRHIHWILDQPADAHATINLGYHVPGIKIWKRVGLKSPYCCDKLDSELTREHSYSRKGKVRRAPVRIMDGGPSVRVPAFHAPHGLSCASSRASIELSSSMKRQNMSGCMILNKNRLRWSNRSEWGNCGMLSIVLPSLD